MSHPNYDRFPFVEVEGFAEQCRRGWPEVVSQLCAALEQIASGRPRCVLAVECYTGLHMEQVEAALRAGLCADHFLSTSAVFKSAAEIEALAAPFLGGDDPLFGHLSPLGLEDLLDPAKRAAFQQQIAERQGTVVVFGIGAVLCAAPDLIVYADMPRWEGQLRQRRGEVSNLGVDNRGTKASLQYKRSYFFDWRLLDRLKQQTLPHLDYLLDTTVTDDPKLVTGAALRAGLDQAVQRPFRVQPFFDPAPWGGQWMKEVCGLDRQAPNFGWCFDCVPEENSLVLQFGTTRVEIPALDLVLYRPRQLLGEAVFGRFGAEFPIRFDLLDTVGGSHLSLQVHPLATYIQEHFGLDYTQDESYYILDAQGDASVYLGLKTGVDPAELFSAFAEAQTGGGTFDAERFVNRWPARRHDHFLIPAGTIHCSGADTVVLEVSATPYLFTFKLWDWERLGLDGIPRPINLDHGRQNLQADRDTAWVGANLINRIEPMTEGDGWREEKTGLHALEFIETRRHWFTGTVPHDTLGAVNVLNLVQGAEAVVESPSGAFAPFVVHYAETFIVPAAVGAYTIRPHGTVVGQECATIKAFVRSVVPDHLLETESNRC